MYFKWHCLLLLFFPLWAQAESEILTSLIAKPDTCVALREGRNCYTDVILTWQQPKIGNYCLRNATTKYIMQCWLKQRTGSFNYSFDSATSITFEIYDSNTSKVLSSAEVKLQWVYQNRQIKRRWRLF
ncbi:DUF3019 domain-containing protein [Pseudoalteromonas sp. MMG010]|uniref:DUF3019 domain-containing protein n=1 Tax=Pseudoalteromonas sp. MMG010 TaxID=2822685 RepID=UPI001B3A28EB|nr:DUF3019 domain-containing protein [Pseudoalteromonas sp. MMG010]MBQ4831722.1 DUF3019 domain-containing protein [Pseudoalteromonas sp. MMG010]